MLCGEKAGDPLSLCPWVWPRTLTLWYQIRVGRREQGAAAEVKPNPLKEAWGTGGVANGGPSLGTRWGHSHSSPQEGGGVLWGLGRGGGVADVRLQAAGEEEPLLAALASAALASAPALPSISSSGEVAGTFRAIRRRAQRTAGPHAWGQR